MAGPVVRLPEVVADRLRRRLEELAPLGSLTVDRLDLDDAALNALAELGERLGSTYPYSQPEYAGQMLKPPHPVAWAAYAATMLLNPNNHSLDGGPATSELEREAVAWLGGMLGLERPLGHLTSSGTIANLEALWVASRLRRGAVIVSGENAHYTHRRMCELVGAKHETVPEDERGRLDTDSLERRLAAGDVGTVVATAGTTSLGALDEIATIADLCSRHGARLHVDAAYGGFYSLLADGGQPVVERAPFAAIRLADSVVIDPHKHGLQPYGCGCVLFADAAVAELYRHRAPYTYYTTSEPHPGEITLECSRAGAAAAALWTTLRALPPTRDGLGASLAVTRAAAIDLTARLSAQNGLELVVEPELDIVCFFARRATASEISRATATAFEALASDGWHIAKLSVDTAWLQQRHPWVVADTESTVVARCCLIKPEHAEIVGALVDALVGAFSQDQAQV